MRKLFVPENTISEASFGEYEKYFDFTDIKTEADILLCRFNTRLNSSYLNNFKSLQVISTLTTGIDHIDMVYCDKKNVQVLSLRNNAIELQNIKSSAEHALLLTLIAARGTLKIFQDSLFNLSNTFCPDLFPSEIACQTFGIVGYGRIGKYLISALSPISRQILFYDPYFSDSVELDNVFKVTSIYDLANVDNLILSCTFNNETLNLIDHAFLKLLALGQPLNIINISRGPIVNAKDFCNSALANSNLKYFLDVGDSYSLQDQELLTIFQSNSGQILCTPHIAGQASSAIFKADMIGLDLLLNWLNGKNNS